MRPRRTNPEASCLPKNEMRACSLKPDEFGNASEAAGRGAEELFADESAGEHISDDEHFGEVEERNVMRDSGQSTEKEWEEHRVIVGLSAAGVPIAKGRSHWKAT